MINQWSPESLTNIDIIDDKHRKLYMFAYKLYKDYVDGSLDYKFFPIDAAIEHLRVHFMEEEAIASFLMIDYKEHKKMHTRIINDLSEAVKHMDNKSVELPLKLNEVLHHHVTVEDKELFKGFEEKLEDLAKIYKDRRKELDHKIELMHSDEHEKKESSIAQNRLKLLEEFEKIVDESDK